MNETACVETRRSRLPVVIAVWALVGCMASPSAAGLRESQTSTERVTTARSFVQNDTIVVARLSNAPRLDGDVTEYGTPTLTMVTDAGPVRVWIARHEAHLYIAAMMPDSTFEWGDDFVISFDPTGRGGSAPDVGHRQWYLRRVLDSSIVAAAASGRWFPPGENPRAIGGTRSGADWDVASRNTASMWTVELRIRITPPTALAPRIAFRTYNNQPRGWWSWPVPAGGLPAQRVEQRPDLWIPMRLG